MYVALSDSDSKRIACNHDHIAQTFEIVSRDDYNFSESLMREKQRGKLESCPPVSFNHIAKLQKGGNCADFSINNYTTLYLDSIYHNCMYFSAISA